MSVDVEHRRIREWTPDVVRRRTVLLRVDHNVPRDRTGSISDETRLTNTLESMTRLAREAGRLAVLTHWGESPRPDESSFSTVRLAERLATRTGLSVSFCKSAEAHVLSASLRTLAPGSILYCENVRFLAGETAGSAELAHAWSEVADVYVNDAFSVCHRSHASVAVLPRFLPAYAGSALMHEHAALSAAASAPGPRALVLGGAKYVDKLSALPELVKVFDVVLLAGLSAVVVVRQMGSFEQRSKTAADREPWARALQGCVSRLELPLDWNVRRADGELEVVATAALSPAHDVVDIGPASTARLLRALDRCRSVFWAGPLGRYEQPEGAAATRALVEWLVKAHSAGVPCFAGGGDTAAAISAFEGASSNLRVSTAGSAALAFMAHGDSLPGLRPLLATRERLHRLAAS